MAIITEPTGFRIALRVWQEFCRRRLAFYLEQFVYSGDITWLEIVPASNFVKKPHDFITPIIHGYLSGSQSHDTRMLDFYRKSVILYFSEAKQYPNFGLVHQMRWALTMAVRGLNRFGWPENNRPYHHD